MGRGQAAGRTQQRQGGKLRLLSEERKQASNQALHIIRTELLQLRYRPQRMHVNEEIHGARRAVTHKPPQGPRCLLTDVVCIHSMHAGCGAGQAL
jgi:hypothetical protein